MRLPLVVLSTVVLVAACTGNPPAQTPILPWSPAEISAAPSSDASAAPTSSSSPIACRPNLPTDDPSTWVELAPAGAGFTIELPAQAAENKVKVATPAGEVPMSVWVYPDGCSRTLMVGRLSFAAGALAKAGSAKQILDQAVAAELQSQKGASVTSQSDVTVGGQPGRRFAISGGGLATDGLTVLAGDDIYMALASTDASHPLPAASLDAFFASFTLTA